MTGVIDRRTLNRATLARQHLLERTTSGVLDVTRHLVGLQAQTPHTWYVGLWSRIAGFSPEQASDLLEQRALVRIALMRSTIHLVTADDALALRPLVAPVIERSTSGNFGKHLVGIDRAELAAAGREELEREPVIFSELGRRLARRWPDRDPASLAQGVRSSEALVQVPPRGLWGRSGAPAHTTAQHWLGRPLAATTVDEMVLRYLTAFGPATVKDVQTWSGLTRLAEVVERLRSGLVTMRDDEGRELVDLPDAPRPTSDVPAPARLLYDYDNLLLSHADRSRVVTESYRRQVWADNYQPRLVLVDGMTDGAWTVDVGRETAVLTVEPFSRWSARDTAAVEREAADLLAFLAPSASTRDVRVLGVR